MKKVLCVFLTLLICLSSSFICFASTTDGFIKEGVSGATPEVKLFSSYARNAKPKFTITSDGTANFSCLVIPNASASVDKIKVVFSITKNNRAVVYYKTFESPVTASKSKYSFSKSFKLSHKGTYTLKTTVHFYKDGKKVETIYCKNATDKYLFCYRI